MNPWMTEPMKTNPTHPLAPFLEAIRRDADNARRLLDDKTASLLENFCNQIEEGLAQVALHPLTLAEAARESGYSTDQLSRLIREGKLVNVGRKGAPRVRRGDLPKKPGGLTWLTPVSLQRHLSRPLGQVARPAVAHGGGR